MRRAIMLGTVVALLVFGVGLVAGAGQETADTCKELGYPENLEADSSGDWGSVDFSDTEDTLTLTVAEGWEVTLCVKAGSANQGNGPEEAGTFTEGEHTVGHSSGKDLSHYGLVAAETVVDDSTTTTLVEETTTTVDDSTTTTAAEDTTTTAGETTTTEAATTTDPGDTTTTPGVDPDTAEELPFTGIPSMLLVALGSGLVSSGIYLVRRRNG